MHVSHVYLPASRPFPASRHHHSGSRPSFPPPSGAAPPLTPSSHPTPDAAFTLRYQQTLVRADLDASVRDDIRNLGEKISRLVMQNKYVPMDTFLKKPCLFNSETEISLVLGKGGALTKIDKTKPNAISSQKDFQTRLTHFVSIALALHPASAQSNFQGLQRVVNDFLGMYEWRHVLNYVEAVRRHRSGTTQGFGGEMDLQTQQSYRVHLIEPAMSPVSRGHSSGRASPSSAASTSPAKKLKVVKKNQISQSEANACRVTSACIAFNNLAGCNQPDDHIYSKGSRRSNGLTLLHQCGLCGARDHGISSPCPQR